MADNQENFVYRIQTEGFDGVKKAIDELAKKIDFLSTKILKQTQLLNSFDAQIKKLNTTISQSTSLSNTEKTQREAQIASITKQKKETQDYIKTLEAEVTSLKNVINSLQEKNKLSTTTSGGVGGSLDVSSAEAAVNITKRMALETRQLKVELVSLAQQSKESYKLTAEGMITAFAAQKRASEEYAIDRKGVEAQIRSYAHQTREAARQLTQEEIQEKKYASEIKKKALQEDMNLSKSRATQLKKEAEEQIKAGKEAKGFAGALGKLGSVGSFVFGSILGMTAIGALRGIVNWFKQAIKAGKEFTTGMYQLAVGVRAMQRVGVDITIKDVYENIEKLRKSFGIFTTQELVEGTASLLNLTRTFGFTKEQIFDLQESILTLAVVNDRAADEVLRVVALALSSGYTEGLQRLGISINKVTIAQKAANLGWDKGYNSLTEYQRALSTYILIQERVAAYEEDLKEYQETAPGRIDKTVTAWEEFRNEIGKDLIPIIASLAERLLSLVPIMEFVGKVLQHLVAGTIALVDTFSYATDFLGKTLTGTIEESEAAFDRWREKFREIFYDQMDLMNAYGEDAEKMPQLGDYLEDDFDDMLQSIEQYGKDLLKAQDEYQEGAKDAEREFGEDMKDIDNDYYEELTEITKDYWETIKEIDEKEQEDILDAREELAKDIADANKDFNEKIAEENEKYRENEIKAQKDYQEALRRLREEFLFDLEDALRKRDASQVMRLIRRYNLDKAQLDRERQEEKEENAKEHKEELADLKKERDDKIKELQEEFAERLAEIQKEAEKERIEADKQRKEEAAEARKNYEEEKKARQEEFNEEMEELKDHLEDRISELQIALADEYNLTDAELRSIGEIYKRMFGAGGVIEGQYDYFAEMTTSVVNHVIAEYQRMKDAADAAMETFAETSDTSNTNGATTAPTYSGAHASGGRVVATRPTLALFGESGIGEVAEFTPLNQVNSNLGGGKANIKISLAKGLIAEIVDNTMGQIGDIQLEVQR